MYVNFYSITGCDHKYVFNSILDSLIENLDYNIGHFNETAPESNCFTDKNKLGISPDAFLSKDSAFSLFENFDFSQKPIESSINVIVIRDFATCYFECQKEIKKPNTGKLWELYFDEFSGETKFLNKKICINYHRWIDSYEYRLEIEGFLSELGLKTSLKDIKKPESETEVPDYSSGSSFWKSIESYSKNISNSEKVLGVKYENKDDTVDFQGEISERYFQSFFD